MSTTIIVGIITIGLFIMVAVAITLQTVEKNNKEKRRLESALNSRSRNFEYMLQGFPDGFLSRDLQVLVCTCLEEVFSQLTAIAPKNKDYRSKLKRAQTQLAEYKAKPSKPTSTTLSDPAQIKEIQKMLSGLYSFISKLAGSKRINTKEAKIYAKQVRRLMVQTSVDGLTGPTKEAMAKGKPRLAIHYLHMVNDKMKKENDDGFYSDRIHKNTSLITQLEEQASDHEGNAQKRREEAEAEWDELDKPDDTWKKKAIYD